MRAANVGKHISPVIVVLNKIALSKPLTVEPSEAVKVRQARDADRWYCEVTGLVLYPFDAILSKDSFVERGRTERVGVINLKSSLPIAIG